MRIEAEGKQRKDRALLSQVETARRGRPRRRRISEHDQFPASTAVHIANANALWVGHALLSSLCSNPSGPTLSLKPRGQDEWDAWFRVNPFDDALPVSGSHGTTDSLQSDIERGKTARGSRSFRSRGRPSRHCGALALSIGLVRVVWGGMALFPCGGLGSGIMCMRHNNVFSISN